MSKYVESETLELKEKYTDVVDVLCVCIDETKYAVFEQGFIRGIVAVKGGN